MECVCVGTEQLGTGIRIQITSGRLAGQTGVITLMRATHCKVRLDHEFRIGQTLIRNVRCHFRDIGVGTEHSNTDPLV